MAVHIPVATTTSITSESPVLERSSPRPIRTHLRTTPVVPPTVWPPPSPPKSPTSRPKSPPLGSPLQPPPLFAPWRRRPTPYCFTYDAGNRPREKPRERDIPKASSPNVSRDGSPRSSRHHRPSQQHHAKYSTSATGSPRTQRTQQQADVNQSEESPIVMEIDENTDVSGISHSDQIPIITEVDDGNDTADTSTPTPKRWFSKSLDTGVLFIRSIVTYTLTAVILVVWIAFTVYVFFMSYVFSALYAIARRCPALLQAALRGAKKGAQLAFEISVKAYRVGKDAYETAFRIWTDYASPWYVSWYILDHFLYTHMLISFGTAFLEFCPAGHGHDKKRARKRINHRHSLRLRNTRNSRKTRKSRQTTNTGLPLRHSSMRKNSTRPASIPLRPRPLSANLLRKPIMRKSTPQPTASHMKPK